MNRTLTESRHVMSLVDKMKGQFAEKNRNKETVRESGRNKEPQKEVEKNPDKRELQRRADEHEGNFTLTNSKEIDLFIFMAEDGRIPDYEFYYMIKEESNDYYNMDIVTYQTVTRRKMT